MSATGRAADPGPEGSEGESAEADEATSHRYFLAIEELFIRLRGAPLVLSPADWHVARRWHDAGIPIEVVRGAIEEVFERRRERGSKGRINSLRYCRTAVEAAWEEIRGLTAAGSPEPAPELEVAPRLAALADALAGMPAGGGSVGEAILERLRALAGDAERVEGQLAALDEELLVAAAAGLSDDDRSAIAGRVEHATGALAARLPEAELAAARTRLERQALRRHLGLPVLSLFSPEAEPRPPETRR